MSRELEGTSFGRLLVIGIDKKDEESHTYWLCRCICGSYTVVRETRLISGKTRSCGCLRVLFRNPNKKKR